MKASLRPSVFWILTFITLLLCKFSFAQSGSHYWSQQYGPKGLLLNGAVIATSESESDIFYNPGALGFEGDFGISVSLLTPSFSDFKAKNLFGKGSRTTDTDFSLFPAAFIAVNFKIFNNKRIKTSFSTFNRFRSNLNLDERAVDVVPNAEDQLFVGGLSFRNRVRERWMGFGFSYRASKTFSFGFSQFITLHSTNYDLEFQKQIVNRQQPDNLLLGINNVIKYNLKSRGGVLTKFGLAWQPGNAKFGLTLTTPTYYRILEKASFDFRYLQRLPLQEPTLNSNYSDNAGSKYKTPLSIGLGADFDFGGFRVSLALEYFKSIERYTQIEELDDPFDGLAQGSYDQVLKIETASKDLLNFAIGFQRKFWNEITLLGGMRTDFNQANGLWANGVPQLLTRTPDIIHFSFGGIFKLWRNQFSLGLDYGFGSQNNQEQLVDFTNVSSENIFSPDPTGNVNSKFKAFTLIFTYDFFFKTFFKK